MVRAERVRLLGMGGFIAFLHILGWGVLALLVAPENFRLGDGKILGLGIGLLVYVLGMRHAFDADHLAAIDNTTRKLMSEGQRPVSVGFWFSLGHSSVVFGMCLLVSLGVKTLFTQVENDSSTLHQITGVIGPTVSGLFLAAIATINLVVLLGILKVFRGMRRGAYDEAELEEYLSKRGFMNRILGRFARAIDKPWKMYPLGFLFGLGFDTATEVSLLVVAGGAAVAALPWYAILCLPVIFAAGMSLFDTIDGTFMNFAYGWAFSNPVRKVFYNIALTGLSVVFAFTIGGAELLSVAADRFSLTGGFWDWITSIDLNVAGFAITGLFVVAWAGAIAYWKLGRVEERWSVPVRQMD
ncbi:HoxN/HupN/NixA family nickel/cobalt transporter [Streptosporangiaceae bacterium NEAU-GS5]|nr:HoxN/HupN/NixA family nickel/cobalt transporter [Streptosporangiaceae bacterium NEAU-GS5]